MTHKVKIVRERQVDAYREMHEVAAAFTEMAQSPSDAQHCYCISALAFWAFTLEGPTFIRSI